MELRTRIKKKCLKEIGLYTQYPLTIVHNIKHNWGIYMIIQKEKQSSL